MTRTLIVTNDFPPRQGGIQSFVHGLAVGRPANSVVVYCSTPPGRTGAQEADLFDLAQPFPVVRERTSVLLPTPAVRRRAARIARLEGCDSALIGSALPLGLLAPGLRAVGARRVVALTHGHEAGWALLPGARSVLHRVGEQVDVLTYLGEYTHGLLADAVSPEAARRMRPLAPGVDTARFAEADGASVRTRHGLHGRAVVVCISRLVPRKGQDALLDAWPLVRATHPGAALLLVGGGRYRAALERRAREYGVADSVVFTDSVPSSALADHYAAGDVFAMPCRTRRGGLDVEGLGVAYLEAAAAGLPVVAGDSGGAPEAVLAGETGFVVNGRDVEALAGRLVALLDEPALARAMGRRGRRWVSEEWSQALADERLDALLSG